ncbi:MAG: F0F1 ATP synthase subunit alpha [Candidatus Levybacteria bacterium RIFCSPLOWO2_01_FULL_36_10]|nr:MAG: F0F1 ATP synthase subunit alpha [Candidatus Levybacteria bacterium RIFCSPLOWO2_01_FULL_36_10]
MKPEEFIKQIEEKLLDVNLSAELINQGIVESVGDGIVKVSGLSKAGYGEEVEFENKSKGLVLNLDEDYASIILLSQNIKINEGDKVKTTGKILSIKASEKLIGRVVGPLGDPLDGKEIRITDGKLYPLEKIAPGVVMRKPVDTPIKTGVIAIDSMTPIGRGQRELIIGDRNTGKSAIAIDTIINQKKKDLGLAQVICVYCPIGQKRGNIARTVAKLTEEGAMDYTIIVAASASDPASLQFLAPLAACAIGEYFMDKGKDVLVVYDDLTRHAWAYRQLSLLLRRPAGREAYPGDIFYLHSRLLERAAKLSKENGGGSLTALPIIETQANDVSAYIPTNVISITDGQIYLEADLFNAGIRPAINAGLSVSRVGGAAQSKGMKQVSGPVRLELAQFRELQAFVQFGSDLDEATLARIERGKRIMEILKQPQFQPLDEVSQIIIIFSATSGLLDNVSIENIHDFEEKVVGFIKLKNNKVIEKIKSGEKMDEKTTEELKKIITEFKKTLK